MDANRIVAIAKAKLVMAQVEKLEIANAKAKGKLVSRDDAIVEISQIFARLRDRWELMPDQITTDVPAELKAAVIASTRRHIQNMLDELSGWATKGMFGEEAET